MDKISYALGLSLGNSLVSSGVESLNFQKFSKAVQDVVEKNSLEMSFEESQNIIHSYFTELQAKFSEQVIKEGKEFLEENAKRAEVVTTDSGLQYEILKEGNGEIPKASDQVKVHYHGTLIDGRVFDSSVERGEPATFGVTQVIQGWVEALQLMPVGSKWRLFIPYNLAYGERGASELIGPYTTLMFDVELLEIVK